MSSFDAAMGKVEAMLSNAQEALRDLPEEPGGVGSEGGGGSTW